MNCYDRVDMMKVDEKIDHLVHLVNAINNTEHECVRDALYKGYDMILENLVELIGTQWCESEKEVK